MMETAAAANLLAANERTLVKQGLETNEFIRYVYPLKSFEAEVEDVLAALKAGIPAKQGPSFSRDFVNFLGRRSVVDALRDFNGKPEALCSKAVEFATDYLQAKGLPSLPKTETRNHFLHSHPDIKAMATSAKGNPSVVLRPGVGFGGGASHPSLVVSGSKEDSESIAKTLEPAYSVSASGAASIDEDLADMVLFFDENQIESIDDMEAYVRWKGSYDAASHLGTLDAYLLT